MTLLIPGFPQSIGACVQDRTLERMFNDAAYPLLLWRAEAAPEKWAANIGERQTFTRVGLIEADTDPLVPGQDPTIGSYAKEQWEAEAAQFGKTIPTHLPTSALAMAPTLLRDTQQLGLHAGLTLNRLPRNRILAAYGGGDTVVATAAIGGALAIRVASIGGFTQQIQDGFLRPVSPTNPLVITFSTAEPANTVTGFIADDPTRPLGSGTLILGAALGNNVALRVGVRAATASRIWRVGGGATVDGITAANILTAQEIINAVALLRNNRMPPHADGTYHCHLSPLGEAQLFGDNAVQRMYQSLPDNAPFRDLFIDRKWGCTFYRNSEMPSTVSTNSALWQANAGGAGGGLLARECGIELRNQAGLDIQRTVITAGGVLVEKYVDESAFISEAGVTGKIGQFSVVNGGVAVMLDRIRFIMAAPLDALQQTIRQSWSWSGDFPCPSDALTGTPARFKRAIILESA